ncbi:MAG TPA: hypothetical protein VFM18_19165 [Methanosarcina sp.]|nr:hypothetical protein [Methanosarcina sp.]
MNKFEKLIEYIINNEDQKARELFHTIVVEKSRDIYESIMDQEEACSEEVAGDEVGDMVDELSAEETVGEGEGDEFGADEFGGEEEVGGDEFAGDEFGGEEEVGGDDAGAAGGDIGDQVMGIDAKLDELLAKFDEIMGDEGVSDEAGEGDEFGADDEFGGEEGAADEFGGEEEVGSADAEEVAEAFGKSGSALSGKSGKSGSGKSGSAKSGKSGKSGAELMREYVDRIGDIYGGEGDAAEGTAVGAAGKKTSVNTKPGSVGPGADFGGTNKNIARGGSEADANGKAIPKPSNEYNKGQGTIKSGNVNVPGGIKGSGQKSTGKEYSKESPKDGSGAGAGKAIGPQNTKSVQKQNTGAKK